MSTIHMLLEPCVPEKTNAQLRDLLDTSFPRTFEGRTYFKQRPHFRFVAHDGETVAGQVGVDARIINVGGTVLEIFGIIDLCVHPDRRRKGLARDLLMAVETMAADTRRDFLVLMADDHRLYEAKASGVFSPRTPNGSRSTTERAYRCSKMT